MVWRTICHDRFPEFKRHNHQQSEQQRANRRVLFTRWDYGSAWIHCHSDRRYQRHLVHPARSPRYVTFGHGGTGHWEYWEPGRQPSGRQQCRAYSRSVAQASSGDCVGLLSWSADEYRLWKSHPDGNRCGSGWYSCSDPLLVCGRSHPAVGAVISLLPPSTPHSIRVVIRRPRSNLRRLARIGRRSGRERLRFGSAPSRLVVPGAAIPALFSMLPAHGHTEAPPKLSGRHGHPLLIGQALSNAISLLSNGRRMPALPPYSGHGMIEDVIIRKIFVPP